MPPLYPEAAANVTRRFPASLFSVAFNVYRWSGGVCATGYLSFWSGNPASRLEVSDEVFQGIPSKGLNLPVVHVFTLWLQFPPTVQRHADYRSTGNSTAPVGVNVFVSPHAFAKNWHEAGSGTQ